MDIETSILIRCFEYNEFTKNTINSIFNTARSQYSLTIMPNKVSAAINSNRLINNSKSKYIILMDDDLQFPCIGWDVKLLETLKKYDPCVVAPRLFDNKYNVLNPQSKINKDRIAVGIKVSGGLLVFKDIGLRYDENYIRTQYDDTDILYQFMSKGYRILVDGRVDVLHMGNATPCSTPWARQNYEYFRKKWKMNDHAKWGKLRYL